MAFPSNKDTPLVQSFSTFTTSHAVNMHGTVEADELLRVTLTFNPSADGASVSTPTGWTQLGQLLFSSGTPRTPLAAVFAKKAVGDEGGSSVDFVTSETATGVAIVERIGGWGGTISTDIDITIDDTGNTADSNPSPVTAGWGSADNRFSTTCHTADDDATITGTPTNYGSLSSGVSGAGTDSGATCGIAHNNEATDSDDPDEWHLSEFENTITSTMVIEPGSSGAASGGGYSVIHRYYTTLLGA